MSCRIRRDLFKARKQNGITIDSMVEAIRETRLHLKLKFIMTIKWIRWLCLSSKRKDLNSYRN